MSDVGIWVKRIQAQILLEGHKSLSLSVEKCISADSWKSLSAGSDMAQYVPQNWVTFMKISFLKIIKITKRPCCSKMTVFLGMRWVLYSLLLFFSYYSISISLCLRALSDIDFEFTDILDLRKAGSDFLILSSQT